jgi:hypothetical protein
VCSLRLSEIELYVTDGMGVVAMVLFAQLSIVRALFGFLSPINCGKFSLSSKRFIVARDADASKRKWARNLGDGGCLR